MMSDLELKLHGPEIQRLLEPGEQVLALTGFRLADGRNQLETPPGAEQDRRRKTGLGVLLLPAAFLLGTWPDPPSPARMLGGVSASGHAGSRASQLVVASGGLRGRMRCLVVTGQRVLLMSKPIWGRDGGYTIGCAIPRAEFTSAVREPRPFARGRVVLHFSDGSLVALRLGAVRSAEASSLITALTRPDTPPRPS